MSPKDDVKKRRGGEEGDNPRATPSRFYTVARCVSSLYRRFHRIPAALPFVPRRFSTGSPRCVGGAGGGEQTGGGEAGYSLISIFRSFASGPSHPICTRLRVQRPLCVYVFQRGGGRRRKEEGRARTLREALTRRVQIITGHDHVRANL